MSACVIFDVDIHDLACDQAFMQGVKPAPEAAGDPSSPARRVSVEGLA